MIDHLLYISNKLLLLSNIILRLLYVKKKFLNLLLILTGSLFSFCSSHYNVPADVKQQLETFGSNKKKFENIIKDYEKEHDSFKLKAIYFIIKNISGLKTVTVTKPLFGTTSIQYDVEQIEEDHLKENIDYAVNSVKDKLTSNTIGFNDFCNYILPYRIGYEKLESWRPKLNKQYSFLVSTPAINDDAVICRLLNDTLTKGFNYIENGNQGIFKGWTTLNHEKKGNCTEMTKMVLYPLRALGVPVTIDYTPAWGNLNGGGHIWNVLIRKGAKNLPFMGLESSPYHCDPSLLIENKTDNTKTTYRRYSKVYRYSFAINNESLPHLNRNNEPTPGYLNDEKIYDVTDEYVHTADVATSYDSSLLSKKIGFAYLCVFNNGDWIPVAWGQQSDSTIIYKKVATHILYLPMTYQKEKEIFSAISHPFYITENDRPFYLNPDKKRRKSITVKYTQSRELDQRLFLSQLPWDDPNYGKIANDVVTDIKRSHPLQGEPYNLFYWDNGWQLAATAYAEKDQVIFPSVPANALYRLISAKETTNPEITTQRIFTINHGSQIWW